MECILSTAYGITLEKGHIETKSWNLGMWEGFGRQLIVPFGWILEYLPGQYTVFLRFLRTVYGET